MYPGGMIWIIAMLASIHGDRGSACPCDYSFIGNACCRYQWRCVFARVDQWQGATADREEILGLPYETENCNPCLTPELTATQTTTFTLTDTGSTWSSVNIGFEGAVAINGFLKGRLGPSFKTTLEFDQGQAHETSVSTSFAYNCGGSIAACQKVAFVNKLKFQVANYTGTVHGKTQVRLNGLVFGRPGCEGQGDICTPENDDDWSDVLTASYCPIGTATVSGRDPYAVACTSEPRGNCDPCNRCPSNRPSFEEGESEPPQDPGPPGPG